MKNVFVTLLLIGLLGVNIFLTHNFFKSRTTLQTKSIQVLPQEIIATTWSWATITSEPVSLVTTNKSDDLRLMRVGFKVGDGSINTALMVSSEHLNMKSSPIPKWKVGDEILIASVPGSIINNVPSPSYIVIDYRSQKQKK